MESNWVKFFRYAVRVALMFSMFSFMLASVHHIATVFNYFEAGQDDMLGSYLTAIAFDVTALFATIAMMFFRKNMNAGIQWGVAIFIISIAGYSFFLNWLYAAHFQDPTLILQATGETTPVIDASGNIRYVAVMKANSFLLIINPLAVSGFTIFALVYSLVAESFGAKPVSVEELQRKKDYLQGISTLSKEVKDLEDAQRGKGFVQAATDIIKAGKDIIKEVKSEDSKEQTDPNAAVALVDTEDAVEVQEVRAKTVVVVSATPEEQTEFVQEPVIPDAYVSEDTTVIEAPKTVEVEVVSDEETAPIPIDIGGTILAYLKENNMSAEELLRDPPLRRSVAAAAKVNDRTVMRKLQNLTNIQRVSNFS